MKHFAKFGLFSLALSLVLGSGIAAFATHKKAAQVQATHAAPSFMYYGGQEFSDDTNSALSYDLNNTPSWGTWNLTGNASTSTFTFSETGNKQKFHYYAATIRVSVTLPAYSHSQFTFNFSASSTCSGSRGEPDHGLEVYFIGANSGGYPSISDKFSYNKDDYTTKSTNALFRVGARGHTTANGSSSTQIDVSNTGPSQDTGRIIYFHVAGYIESSNYDHTLSASLTTTITENNITYACYNATYGTYHDTLSGAVAGTYSKESGGTIRMLKNYTEASLCIIQKSLTIDLQGYTLTFSPASAQAVFFLIRGFNGAVNNCYFSITGNGTVTGAANDALIIVGDGKGSSYDGNSYKCVIGNGTTVNATGGSAISVQNNATLDAQAGSTLRSTINTVRVNGNGKASFAGTVTSSGRNAVYCDSAACGSVGLYGTPVLTPASSSYASIYVDGTPAAAKIYGTDIGGSTMYRGGTQITIEFSGSVTSGTTIVYGIQDNNAARGYAADYLKLKHSTLKLGFSGSTSMIATPITYTISFNAGEGTGSMSNVTRNINTSYTIPTATFTAPNFKTFHHWNTKANGTGITYNVGDTYTVTANLALYAFYYQTDENIYDEFRLEYLHMTTYTVESGYCLDGDSHHYFQTASGYFADHMSKAQRLYFRTNYTAEWTRFEAWASANHKTVVLDEEGNYSVETKGALTAFKMDTPVNMILIVSSLALLGAGALAYMLIRKKKSVK